MPHLNDVLIISQFNFTSKEHVFLSGITKTCCNIERKLRELMYIWKEDLKSIIENIFCIEHITDGLYAGSVKYACRSILLPFTVIFVGSLKLLIKLKAS